MKKLIALVLTLCMMMSVLLVPAAAKEILQDEQPPVLLGVKLFDAQGNLIAEFDPSALPLTDIHHRTTEQNEEAASRMASAYAGVMGNVHHGDVDCHLHDHDVKVDINAVLSSIHHEMDAHDLVMYEMFDVNLPDEIKALMTEGSYLELTLKSHAKVGAPLIAMFTHDGENWMVQPTEAHGNAFKVQLPSSGLLSLLCDGEEHMDIGKLPKNTKTTVSESYTIETSNFTPSVSGKSAPQVISYAGQNGEVIIGYLRSNSGNPDIPVPDRNYVIITSVADRNYTLDIQTHEHLEWSYDSILEAEDLGELFTEHDPSLTLPDHDHQTLAAALDKSLADRGLNLTHDQLVVKDLFEVSAYGKYLHQLYKEDYHLELTFAVDYNPAKPLTVIHSTDSKHWHVHDAEDMIINPNGSVTLKMYDLGSVAFLVEGEYTVNPEGAVQAP